MTKVKCFECERNDFIQDHYVQGTTSTMKSTLISQFNFFQYYRPGIISVINSLVDKARAGLFTLNEVRA